jgi:hypothetical protein
MAEPKLDTALSRAAHNVRKLANGSTIGILEGGDEQNDPLVQAGWVVPGHPVWTRDALRKPYNPKKKKLASSGSGDPAA